MAFSFVVGPPRAQVHQAPIPRSSTGNATTPAEPQARAAERVPRPASHALSWQVPRNYRARVQKVKNKPSAGWAPHMSYRSGGDNGGSPQLGSGHRTQALNLLCTAVAMHTNIQQAKSKRRGHGPRASPGALKHSLRWSVNQTPGSAHPRAQVQARGARGKKTQRRPAKRHPLHSAALYSRP